MRRFFLFLIICLSALSYAADFQSLSAGSIANACSVDGSVVVGYQDHINSLSGYYASPTYWTAEGAAHTLPLRHGSITSFGLKILDTEMISVFDEVHIFNDPFPFTLNNRNIDVTSIVITDVTNSLVYTEGDDYMITEVGDIVEITPTTLGVLVPNIYDGQTLLVDYLYIPEPATIFLLALGGMWLRINSISRFCIPKLKAWDTTY